MDAAAKAVEGKTYEADLREKASPAEDLDSMFDDVLAEVTGKPKKETRQELFAELRERLGKLSDRALDAGDGSEAGRIRGFTHGMSFEDSIITREWVDDVVAEREKIVRRLEKKAGIKAEPVKQERTADQASVESIFTGEPKARFTGSYHKADGNSVNSS